MNILETILPATEKDEEEVLDWIIPEMSADTNGYPGVDPKSRTAEPPPMASVETGKGENKDSIETGKGEKADIEDPLWLMITGRWR